MKTPNRKANGSNGKMQSGSKMKSGSMLQASPKPTPVLHPFGKGDTVTLSAEGKKLAAEMRL